MKSKITIDVDEQGLPTLQINRPYLKSSNHYLPYDEPLDVRDKLVHRFLDGNVFAVIAIVSPDDNSLAEIHPMGPMDVIRNLIDFFMPMINDKSLSKDYEQSLMKAASILESELGFKSISFLKACERQSGAE